MDTIQKAGLGVLGVFTAVAMDCAGSCKRAFSPIVLTYSQAEDSRDNTLEDLGTSRAHSMQPYTIDFHLGGSPAHVAYTDCTASRDREYMIVTPDLVRVYDIQREVYLITQQAACLGERNPVDEIRANLYMLSGF